MKLLIALLFTAISFGQDSIPVSLDTYPSQDSFIIIDRDYVITPNESEISPFAFENQIYQNNIIVVRDEKYLVRETKEGGFLLTPLRLIDYELKNK